MGRICVAVVIAVVIGVAELASAPASMAATTGLVAAYGFDEGSGTTVTDASGNGNNGTITNATWVTTGKYGEALKFNGTQRAGHDPRRGLAAPVDRDDAGGVGQPLDGQRQLA